MNTTIKMYNHEDIKHGIESMSLRKIEKLTNINRSQTSRYRNETHDILNMTLKNARLYATLGQDIQKEQPDKFIKTSDSSNPDIDENIIQEILYDTPKTDLPATTLADGTNMNDKYIRRLRQEAKDDTSKRLEERLDRLTVKSASQLTAFGRYWLETADAIEELELTTNA